MNIEEILVEFSHVRKGNFPEAAMLAARESKAKITPHLLQAITTSPQALDERLKKNNTDDETCWLFDFAMYLLAEFREPEAYPHLISFFSTPGELTANITGDIVTEDLPSILASTYNGDMMSLFNLIENNALDPYVRAAACYTLITLQNETLLERDQVVSFFSEFMQQHDWQKDHKFADVFASSILDLTSTRLRPLLEKMFDNRLVNEFDMPKSDIKNIYNGNYPPRIHPLINNAAEKLKKWHWFQDTQHSFPDITPIEESGLVNNLRYVTTYQREAPKIGRNDPCPCGSGKKFKKCCLH